MKAMYKFFWTECQDYFMFEVDRKFSISIDDSSTKRLDNPGVQGARYECLDYFVFEVDRKFSISIDQMIRAPKDWTIRSTRSKV
jgi:hypothetical protein